MLYLHYIVKLSTMQEYSLQIHSILTRNSMISCTTRPIRRTSINFSAKLEKNTMKSKTTGGLEGSEKMPIHYHTKNVRPEPDQVFVDIAEYVTSTVLSSPEAYTTVNATLL